MLCCAVLECRDACITSDCRSLLRFWEKLAGYNAVLMLFCSCSVAVACGVVYVVFSRWRLASIALVLGVDMRDTRLTPEGIVRGGDHQQRGESP